MTYLSLYILILFAVNGCDWDPPRDNPYDPGHYMNIEPPESVGSLVVRVLTLAQTPVSDASVVFEVEGGTLTIHTDSAGEVIFEDVPTGTWWVMAFKDNDGGPTYVKDSVQVSIEAGRRSSVILPLDALPMFVDDPDVNSKTYKNSTLEPEIYYARLKALVDDPDGPADIIFVKWRWSDDTLNQGKLTGLLNYQPDSGFYSAVVPSDSFPGGKLSSARNGPFFFEIFDHDSNSTLSEPVELGTIISDVPDLDAVQDQVYPLLRWEYRNNDQFSFLIRVWTNTELEFLVYDTLLTSPANFFHTHRMQRILERGAYYWYVWVLDLFGNSSRSARGQFSVSGLQ